VLRYDRNLSSIHWLNLRDAVNRRAGGRCEWREDCPRDGPGGGERCTQTRGLQLHHLHYRSPGAETLNDVELLCDWHHRIQTVLDRACELCGCEVYDRQEAEAQLRHWMAHAPECRVADLLRLEGGRLCCACAHFLGGGSDGDT
jgi:hypothetical protein